ncbi:MULTISPECIES: zinc-binding metallopeptidase [Bacteroides]|uniref:zinc-binding metallopeptidase n=1 Tax=Bacteroides TaxID=816 RepID=UPI001C3C1EF1|nr:MULTISPECIES: putative zinc-binding metallopeptidase [Bacteroides]
MKTIRLYLYLLLALSVYACNDEDFTPNPNIVGLGGDTWIPTELDYWIEDNFTDPYNMEVKYRWDQSELDLNRTLVPVKENLVIPVMETVKKVWIEPYEKLAGNSFIKKLSPKKYVLVGSPKYNPNGTITLGEAEGGRKIVLYRLNWFEQTDKDLIQAIMKTVHHEFGHTMHQTTMYPAEFKYITPGGYTSSWNNVADETALKLGYVSSYACSNSDEDFVETLSRILVYGRAWFEKRVSDAKAIYTDPQKNQGLTYDPSEALRTKESYVINYMKEVWGISIYDTIEGQGLESLVQEAINEVTGSK